MTSFYLFAGELSGDLHGSQLIRSLRHNNDSASFKGVGGPLMRKEGLECLFPMENFQVMGFTDVLKSLPTLSILFYKVRQSILNLQPDCLILIDYPGFNLRLGKSLRKKGFKGKIVQYICPTVWAHGKKRIETLAAHFDLLLTIYPFESSYFSHTQLPVQYIGHPVVDTIRSHPYNETEYPLLKLAEKEIIALFPGSRNGEIKRHLPQQLQIAAQLKQKHPNLTFVLCCAHNTLVEEFLSVINQSSLQLNIDLFVLPPEYRYEVMKIAKTALAKSGTVTLELALHHIPTVVHYELSTLNYFFASVILKLNLPYYCIVNLLNQKRTFPEYIGRRLPLEKIQKELEILHFDTLCRIRIKDECEQMNQILGHHCTHQRAAQMIQELIIDGISKQ